MITLTLKEKTPVPLEADAINPDIFLGKTANEIARMPVYSGNQEAQLGDFFTVSPNGGEEIVLEGDLSRVKQIGTKMTQGRITIYGDVGMHLGASMRGGVIEVFGSAGDWAGAEMGKGLIHIHGSAGHGLGSAYRGSPRGMNRGMILVDGSAGNEVGAAMRRGMIAVLGDVGDFAGAFMIAGSLVVFGRLGSRAGAGMKRGTIVTFQPPELLPTFRYACVYQPAFLRLMFNSLRERGIEIAEAKMSGNYHRYSGDLTALGKGEILVYDQH